MMEPMDISRALEQLDEIRHHLGRSEIYRGYRSKTLTIMGIVALLSSTILSVAWPHSRPIERVGFWVAVAAVNLAIASWEIMGDYSALKTDHEKRTTRRTVGQFLPALVGGAVITLVFASTESNLEFLPGLWAVLFSLGIFASRPYLPRGVGWVGAYFLAIGSLLLFYLDHALAEPFVMGAVFAGGLFMFAYVLYQNLERKSSHES